MTQAGHWFDFEEFTSMTGFHAGLRQLAEKGEVRWTNTATDMHTGGIHALRYKVEKDPAGSPLILLQHWVHWPGGKIPADEQKKRRPQIMVLRTETRVDENGITQIRPTAVEWMGKTSADPEDIMSAMHFLQETATEIRDNILKNSEPGAEPSFSRMQRRQRQTKRRDEIPNLYHIAQRCNFKSQFALEGMYYNGEFNFSAAADKTAAPSYPLPMLRAMLGIESDWTEADGKPFSKSFTMANPEGQGYEGVTYQYTPDGTRGFTLSCQVWDRNAQGARNQNTLYSVRFERDAAAGSNMLRLAGLEMLGAQADVTDHKGVARAIRAMKYIHLAIKRDEPPMLSDIIHEHDLKAYLRKPEAPQTGPRDPRTMVQVFGANMDAAFSQKEKSIGSNGAIIIRDFMNGKDWVKLGIGVDWGVTFGDPEKDFYHTIAQNYGRFVRHPAAPDMKPYVDTMVMLETHEHEDHMRGVARLAKFGFALPPLVLNEHSFYTLKYMMSEEKVEASVAAEILKNCHVIKFDRYKKPGARDKDQGTFTYGNTVIHQGVEEVWSESEKAMKYFPLLTIHNVGHPDAKTTVRVGPAGHSAHALMFQVDGILYTGDYRLDQTLPAKLRTDLDWLAQCKETAAVHIQESTNATVPDGARIVTAAEVKGHREAILRQHTEGRILADMIGSNATDIEMFCRTLGEIRNEKKGEEKPFQYVVFAGGATRRKYGHLNKSESFKTMMKEQYGIKTLHVSSKKAQELLAGGGGESYVVINTGTQDERLSITHRVSRDLHDTIHLQSGDTVLRLQRPIPGDNRQEVRRAQNNRYRHDFGCVVYDSAEQEAKNAPIAVSSHATPQDYKTVHDLTGDLLKLLNHGGPAQLQAMKRRMDDMGARAMIPEKQPLYEIDRKNRTVKIAGETPEERVGYREIRADEDEFYDKQRQQATVYRVKDRWAGDAAARMYAFESAVQRREDRLRTHAPTARGSNAMINFNDAAGTATDFPLIGVLHPSIKRPYHENHRNIKVFVGVDTETTGANPDVDVHTDISFVATDPHTGAVRERRTLKYAVPRYMMPAPGALAVTGNDKPESVHEGLPLREYAHQMLDAYQNMPRDLSDGDKRARGLYFGYRNGVFDDKITMRMLGTALVSRNMKPMAGYGNLQLDVFNLYSALLALSPDKVAGVKDKDGHYVRNLGTVCEANGITVDKTKTHGSAYDAELTAALLHKLRKDEPDLFEQIVMNCDFSSSRRSPMIDQILGQNMPLNAQAPVFGYVNPRDRNCTPHIGGLVTIDTKVSRATSAIVIDLAKADPHQLDQLSDEELMAAMNDRNGPFTVIKLNDTPLIFPPQFVYRDPKVRAKAVGRLPKTTLLQRANALKQMRSSTQEVGNNFIQRVQRLYPKSRMAYGGMDGGGNRPVANDNSFRLPGERIFSIFHVIKGVNQIKNRHYKAAAQLLQSVKITKAEFEPDFDAGKFWTDALKRARDLSVETGGRDPYIEDVRLLIEWMAHDIDPQFLPSVDRDRVNALKSAMLHGPDTASNNTVERFRREIAELEASKERLEQLFGKGPAARRKWEETKATYLEYADMMDRAQNYAMDEQKRETVRQFRRTSPNPGGRGPRMG